MSLQLLPLTASDGETSSIVPMTSAATTARVVPAALSPARMAPALRQPEPHQTLKDITRPVARATPRAESGKARAAVLPGPTVAINQPGIGPARRRHAKRERSVRLDRDR